METTTNNNDNNKKFRCIGNWNSILCIFDEFWIFYKNMPDLSCDEHYLTFYEFSIWNATATKYH